MAHLNKRKHVKHMKVHAHHEQPPQPRHRYPAASFHELGLALFHRIYMRLTRRPRALFQRITGLYSRASA